MKADTSPSRRSIVVALATLAGLSRIHGCEPPEASAPNIAWDGTAYIAVWETPDDSGVSVRVRRFTKLEAGLTTAETGTEIHHTQYGLSQITPGVVSGTSRTLVIIDPNAEAPFAVPLDHDGAVAGPQQPLTACSGRHDFFCVRPCRRSVAVGDEFIVGYVAVYPQTGLRGLQLSFLDRDGKTVRYEDVPSYSPNNCALASNGEDLVIAFGDEGGSGEPGIRVLTRALTAGSTWHHVWIADGGAALALESIGDEFALLYRTSDGLHLARSTRAGVRESFTLSDSIDVESADLGVSERGLFVTWLRDGKVHVRDISAKHPARTQRVPSTAVGTRAVGVGDRCVVAWSSGGGTKLQLLAVEKCP